MTPIQVGCANNKKRKPGILYDDEGENISKLNPMYCELTAQYWAWKNLDADYYGFCHYRRYFNFSQKRYEEDPWGNIVEKYPGEFSIEKYGQDEESIHDMVLGNDIIITKIKNIKKMPDGAKTIYQQYEKAPFLNPKDIHEVKKIIDELTPEYSESAEKFLNGHHTCFCNMYILKKELFFEYCEWCFKILEEFCKRTDMSEYSTEALRTPGHLSERLFNIFLIKLRKDRGQNLRIKELQCIYFEDTEKQNALEPVFKKNAVPVVLAANNDYVPVFATCLQSILDTTKDKYNYDIVLIQSDIIEDNKQGLLAMVSKYKNVSLRFYNATSLLADYDLVANEHITVETFYRFLIQEAMPKYDKVLYIDCDLIVKNDLGELFETDVDDYLLAAVRDVDFAGQINGANKTTSKYAEKRLKLKNPLTYFQAGVILFNEKEMRKAHSLDEWLDFATERYKYSDQDVLNKYCQGKVKYLDMSWNFIFDHWHQRVKEVVAFAPDYIQKEYAEARKHPCIIHYAGAMKPWFSPKEEFARDFWLTARKTPFYEELIYNMGNKNTALEIKKLATNVSFKGRIKNRATRFKKYFFGGGIILTLFPLGSRRRKIVKNIRNSLFR